MSQNKKKKEIIENDKKNKSNEWEWGKKWTINDKNDDNMIILR